MPTNVISVSAADTVHAIVPLSILEALRNLDTPVEDGLEELAGEIVAKRLGLSATVAAQIARYQESAAHDRQVPFDEAVAVFRLAGRRSDAGLVFADAGRRAARYAARSGALPLRALVSATPGSVSRRLGIRAAESAARRILQAELRVRGIGAEASVPSRLSIQAMPDGAACAFYTAAFAELLRCLIAFEGTMRHETCRGRGGDGCHWRAALGGGYD